MDLMEENGIAGRSNKPKLSPEELFGLFSESTDFKNVLELFEELLSSLSINKHEHRDIYTKLKTKLTSWKCQSLWDLIDSRAKHAEYEHGKGCSQLNVLVIGAGPIGLRTAIETAFLGCRTVIVEKRTCFTRNNVLHLWPFLLTDFRGLGAKKFYGKFCAGSIDHISIKQLQSILLKVCLILGVRVITGIEFKELVEPCQEKGWKGVYHPQRDFLSNYEINVIVGADGKKDVLPGFPQIEMRGALAIGITCNFINENSMAEAGVEEISGIAYQFNPKFFDDLKEQFDVGLENIVYYKDETHYFVMTVLKSSLLKRGALKQDFADPSKLLERQNIDHEKLVKLTMDTVHYATKYKLPSTIKLAKNPNGTPDIAVFDFTSLKKSTNASRIVERKGKRLLMTLVGDSLLQPFWPTGSGCGRGVLSSLDAAWMIRLFGMDKPPLTVLWEREKIFKLLSGTDSKHLQKNYKSFTIDPKTRYSNLSHVSTVNIPFLKKLYDTDDPENADYSLPETLITKFEVGRAATMHPPRSRRKSIGKRRSHSAIVHKRRSDRTTLKEAKHVSKAKAVWEDKVPQHSEIGGPSKRTRPSVSISGSSGLSSVSESDQEEPSGPYQRAMSLRKRNQSSELSDVFTASSTEALDAFEESSKALLKDADAHEHAKHRKSGHKHPHVMGDRLGYKHVHEDKHEKGHGGVMRFLFGRGKGEHETERRKSVAARKSLSRARRHRRKSGAGSQSQSEDQENTSLVKHKQNLKSVTLRKKPNREPHFEAASHATVVKKLSDNDKGSVRSAKDLIAAAEARDSRKSVMASKTDSLKRKADDVRAEEKPSRFDDVAWKHCVPAVEPLLPDEEQNLGQPYSVQNASQIAGLLLLAVPFMLPCRPRLTGKPNMMEAKRNTLLRSSMEKRETRKISLTRAGSVQRAVAQYKTKLEQDSTRDFQEFKRNKSSGSLKKDGLLAAGNRLSFHGRSTEEIKALSANNSINSDDYEIIEMKGGSLHAKEVQRVEDDFDVISGSEVRQDELEWLEKKRAKKMIKTNTKKKKHADILRDHLEELCCDLRASSVLVTLEILLGIHRSIISNANIDRFYRIYTRATDFANYVWNVESCRSFLKQVGWQLCGKFIVLSKSTSVHEAVDCLEEAKRNTEQLLARKTASNEANSAKTSESKSVPKINLLTADFEESKEAGNYNKQTVADDQSTLERIKTASPLRPEFISKDELFQLIDSLDESNIDPGTDDVESSEGFIGEEEYLIVDFASNSPDNTVSSTHATARKGQASIKHIMSEDVYGKDGRRRRRKPVQERDEKEAKSRERRSEESKDQDLGLEQMENRPSLRERRKLREERNNMELRPRNEEDKPQQRRQDDSKNGKTKTAGEQSISVDGDLYGPDGRRRRRSAGQKRESRSEKSLENAHINPRLDNNNTSSQRPEVSKPAGRTRDTASKELNINKHVEVGKSLSKTGKMDVGLDEKQFTSSLKGVEGAGVQDFEDGGEKLSVLNSNLLKINGSSFDDSGSETGKKKKKKLVLKKGSMRRKKLQENGELITDEKRSLQKSGLCEITKPDESNSTGVAKENVPENGSGEIRAENVENVSPGSKQDKIDLFCNKNGAVLKAESTSENIKVSGIKNGLNTSNVISNSLENKGKEIIQDNGVSKDMNHSSAEVSPKREKKRKFVLKVKRKKNKDPLPNGDSLPTPAAPDQNIEQPKLNENGTEHAKQIEKSETLEDTQPKVVDEVEKIKKKKFVLRRKKKA